MSEILSAVAGKKLVCFCFKVEYSSTNIPKIFRNFVESEFMGMYACMNFESVYAKSNLLSSFPLIF